MFQTCLIADFEQANVCQVHLKKTSTFKDKIGYNALLCIILTFIIKWHLNLYLHNRMGESVRNFWEGVYFRL